MSVSLPQLEKFVTFLHEVERIKRVARRPDETEPTNTAEHTFEVAMTCWYIASLEGLPLNFEKILKYALAHDLIEAYAGDTYVFDTEKQLDKSERERKAVLQIEHEFAEFTDLIQTIHNYEAKADPESRFVYAADKLIDPLNISLEKGTTLWKDKNVSYQAIRSYKDAKIAKDETIKNLWEELVAKLESDLGHYFPD